MLSDSTGYGGSSGNSSLYSTCVVVPASSALSSVKASSQKQFKRKFNKNLKQFSTKNDEFYVKNGYLKYSKRPNNFDDTYCDFQTDSDLSDEIEVDVDYRKKGGIELFVDTSLNQFYDNDYSSEVKYDQCATEMESCFQSVESSRMNTAPFSSPVENRKENSDVLKDDYSVSATDFRIMTVLKNEKGTEKDEKRPICSSKVAIKVDEDLEENPRSLVKDTCEYHKGNSVRFRTMPMPMRASVVNNGSEPSQAGILIKPDLFLQPDSIGISSELYQKKIRWRNMSPITEVDTIAENEITSLSTFLDSDLNSRPLQNRGSYSEKAVNLDSQSKIKNKIVPPEKPPRGRLVSVQSTSKLIKNKSPKVKKSATMKHEKSTEKLMPKFSGESKRKNASIKIGSCETVHFNKNDCGSLMDSYGMFTCSASLSILSATPKKSILKQPSIKPPYQFEDPNDALFGPIEHIYEYIDSDPSSVSSEDDRCSLKTSIRPSSFTFSSTHSNLTQKSRRSLPDLRPELPVRPFCWPFVLFPPDMTFQPKSLHAYHRREALEAGNLPLKPEMLSESELESNFAPPNAITIIKCHSSSGFKTRIARMPSILSKVM